MNLISIIILVLCGLPLIVIPFAFIATLMAIASYGQAPKKTNLPLTIISFAFMISACAYPIPYFIALKSSMKAMKLGEDALDKALLAPYSLALVIILFFLWLTTEKITIKCRKKAKMQAENQPNKKDSL